MFQPAAAKVFSLVPQETACLSCSPNPPAMVVSRSPKWEPPSDETKSSFGILSWNQYPLSRDPSSFTSDWTRIHHSLTLPSILTMFKHAQQRAHAENLTVFNCGTTLNPRSGNENSLLLFEILLEKRNPLQQPSHTSNFLSQKPTSILCSTTAYLI